MSKTTTKHGLIKPELTDPADITQFNENWDKIDEKLNNIPITSEVPSDAEMWIDPDDVSAEEAHLTNMNNPHGVTIEQIGAAPTGYGFGGKPISLATGLLNNDAGLETALEAVYSQMGSTETKLVRFAGYPSTSDYNWFGFLSKSSDNYGSLVVYSAFTRGTYVTKTKFNGTWQPLEWVNPPMLPGVEYRTTERHNGKPVYVKRINFGALPATGGSNISTGISGGTLVKLTGTLFETDGTTARPYPLIDWEGIKCYCWVAKDCDPLCVQVNKDCSEYTGNFIIEYTKD